MTTTNENEKDPRPRRLTVVLNDPNAEWRDIRSAMSMRAKTSVLGCSTNLAIINSSCSGGVGPDGKRSNLILAAADYVEAAEGSWEASAESSNRRPSRRSSRCASRKRCSLRWSSRSSAADSVNMLDFGVSQHLAMLDESNRSSVPDESRRRCASLDELFEIENSGEESERSLETRSEADLDDVDSHGFMNYWPLTPREEVDDGGKEKETIAGTNGTTLDQIGAEEGKTSHTSQESYNNRRASRRSVHRHSTRRSSRQGSHRWSGRSRSSASSLGSSNFSDSLISESGFMAWPSAAQEDVKREEEEWNIEDYEKNVDNSDRNDLRLSEGSSGPDPSAFVNTLHLFARVPSRHASNALSGPCHDGPIDLIKIKQTLLSAKNKNQGLEEAGEDTDKKKRGGSISLISMFWQSMVAELDNVEKKTSPMHLASMNESGDDEPRRRRSREQAIWMLQKSTINDDPDVYKKLYAQAR